MRNRRGSKERSAEFLRAEYCDNFLTLGRSQPADEEHGIEVVDVRVPFRVCCDYVIGIEQSRIPLYENREVELLAKGQKGSAVGKGVSPLLVRDDKHRAHSAP